MSLNIPLLKAKAPYFIFLFFVWMFAQVLFHGFCYMDLIFVIGASVFVLWKPNIFSVFPKKYTYSFMSELPLYLGFAGIFVFAYTVGSHLQTITMNFLNMIIMCVLMTLSLIIIDRSRYTD